MGKLTTERSKIEFGDFQTPEQLAFEISRLLVNRGVDPLSIVEPTCGVGNLLFAAIDAFPRAKKAWAAEVNAEYVAQARVRAAKHKGSRRVHVQDSNFFKCDWRSVFAEMPEPILIIGNPPWVTSADLSYLQSHNIPAKANFHGRSGLDAVTGKSNFDISEWMILKVLESLEGRRATVALLCKTAVARKALAFSWTAGFRIQSASIFRIDSATHFDAAVDACLLLCEVGPRSGRQICAVYERIDAPTPTGSFGFRDEVLVADTGLYDRRSHLIGESCYQWRSGVKHDCAAIMELRPTSTGYMNGVGESLDIEDNYLYPMMKSSDVAREGSSAPSKWMIITQNSVGADTVHIREHAEKTWHYLTRHRAKFDNRGSSIYRGKPPFSIFGVGDYTFAPWKVAISGLYKKLEFKVVGPHLGKPVVLDDTCYFAPCQSEAEARLLARLLASAEAREFFAAFVFWDAKRPITTELLRRLDLRRLADEVGLKAQFERLCSASTAKSKERRKTGQQTTLSLEVECDLAPQAANLRRINKRLGQTNRP